MKNYVQDMLANVPCEDILISTPSRIARKTQNPGLTGALFY